MRGTEIPVAWFAQGLRFVDFSNPMAPRESAHYIPDRPPGADRVSSNDVFEDDRGVVYLIDRIGGLSIVERIWPGIGSTFRFACSWRAMTSQPAGAQPS